MLQLFIDNQQAVLDADTSIDIEVASPIWNPDTSGAFAYEFELDIELNRHIFGTADEIHGDSIYNIDGKKFKLFADGILMYSGIVQLDDEVEIEDGKVSITLASGNREFNDIIADMNCRDVKLIDDIEIGTALERIEFVEYIQAAHVHPRIYKPQGNPTPVTRKGKVIHDRIGTSDIHPQGSQSAYVKTARSEVNLKSEGLIKWYEDKVNLTYPYSRAHPYFNMRLSWQKYRQKTGDNSWEKEEGYETDEEIVGASRIGSAPCFYVGYFLDCLFSPGSEDDGHTNIIVTGNQLTDIPDFLRLGFITTKCGFDGEVAPAFEPFRARNDNFDIPDWILVDGYPDSTALYRLEQYLPAMTLYQSIFGHDIIWPLLVEDVTDTVKAYDQCIEIPTGYQWSYDSSHSYDTSIRMYPSVYSVLAYESDVHLNSDCFPDTEVTSVVNAVQGMFGARFIFDSNNTSVSIVTVDNVLSDNDVIYIPCIVHRVHKRENNTKGFRLKYSAASDPKDLNKEKKQMLGGLEVTEKLEYDYGNYSHTTLKGYALIKKNIGNYDARCFYNPKTGNAYRIKVNEDAETETELKPSLFEVGQFQSYEFGDCSNEDYIEEVSLDFTPLINNISRYDNYTTPMPVTPDNDNMYPVYARLLDVEIHPGQRFTSNIRKTHSIPAYSWNLTGYGTVDTDEQHWGTDATMTHALFKGYEHDGYDTECPIQAYDNGLTLGFMRGPGTDGGTTIYDVNYDGEGNSKWEISAGTYATHQDSIDDYGNAFDYNGSTSGVGLSADDTLADRLTLRLRAEKPNPAYDPSDPSSTVVLPGSGESVPNTPFLPIAETAAKRGLGDKFYAKYAYWLTHHKTAILECTIELATLVNIDLTKRVRIGDYTGFINKIDYSINDNGVGDVLIELYYL